MVGTDFEMSSDDLGLDLSSSSASSSPVVRRRRKRRRQRQGGRASQFANSAARRYSSVVPPAMSRRDAIVRSVFPDQESEVLYDRFVQMNINRLEAEAGEVTMFDRVLPTMSGNRASVQANRVIESSVPGVIEEAASASSSVEPTESLARAVNDVVDGMQGLSGKREADDDEDDLVYHPGASRENPATVPIKFVEMGVPFTGLTDANAEVRYEEYVVDPTGSGWLTYFGETFEHLKAEHDRLMRSLRTVSELDYLLDPNTHNVDTPGGLRFKAVQEQLDGFGVVRSADQRTFHEAMFNATLPLIYGDSWDECSTSVMRARKIERVEQEALILAPRRWGKTWAVAMYVAALLLHVPGIKIAVFSPTGRQSGFLKEYILDFVCRAKYGRQRIVRDKNEELYVSQHPLPAGKGQHSAVAKEWAQSPLSSKAYFLPGTVVGTFLIGVFVAGGGHPCCAALLNWCVGIASWSLYLYRCMAWNACRVCACVCLFPFAGFWSFYVR